ncbi:hypothetical protein ACFVVX_07820 [Kitasatospora sp. NPDC058170]
MSVTMFESGFGAFAALSGFGGAGVSAVGPPAARCRACDSRN